MMKWVMTILYMGFCSLALTIPATADDLSSFDGESGTVKISGGTAHIPVMKEAAKRIMMYNSDIRISIAGGGSGAGIKQVGEQLVDIGNSGRKPTAEEISRYNLKLFKWAVDGVGIVINPENPVTDLTQQQLKDVFAGKISNWSELGWKNKTINLYTRDAASGTRSVFWKKALKKGEISSHANFVVSNGAMKTAVAGDPYAIGYVSVGHIDRSVKPVVLDGVFPSLENVKQGTYKVARGLYSNTSGQPTGLTKKLIDYLFSGSAKTIISKKGFIPVD
ncbi:MAG: phosphate ABC transporter substrate-binding protein [Proteobacteria bacterium]|nr:phosphate ABC transporter substrate-binding protein [Pseudomonadota bacterium]